jgi:hypothetical protein
MNKSTEKFLKSLEKVVIGKLQAIKRKEILPQDSGIGVQLNRIKQLDEVCYLNLVKEYKVILKSLENEQS